MKKIELTISSNYVPGWTIADAVRELFQNALDQETESPDNKASWEYDAAAQTLSIRNKKSSLTTQSLLFGETTKDGNHELIGQFGEGYKLATLVLLRNNKEVTIYNYGEREVWRPRFVKSRRFGTKILTFFIDTWMIKAPDNDLTIVIEGLTPEEWEQEIVPSNLRLRTGHTIVASTGYGEILDLPGQVFVNGLFVCTYKPYSYGYNFRPGKLRLDRDRKLVSDFDLRWIASKMWEEVPEDDLVLELLEQGAPDVQFLSSSGGVPETRANLAYQRFTDEYGPTAVPVVYQAEIEGLPESYKPIVVDESYQRIITASARYTPPLRLAPEQTIAERLQEWYDNYKYLLSYEAKSAFEIIIDSAN